jgi:glutaredoxin
MNLIFNFLLLFSIVLGFSSNCKAQDLPLLLSASWCPVCIIARGFLEKQGITFQELDIDTSSEGKQLMKRSGAMGPPVLFVDGAFFSGFDPIAWSKALNRSSSKLKKNNFLNEVNYNADSENLDPTL